MTDQDTRPLCPFDGCHRREPCGSITCGYEYDEPQAAAAPLPPADDVPRWLVEITTNTRALLSLFFHEHSEATSAYELLEKTQRAQPAATFSETSAMVSLSHAFGRVQVRAGDIKTVSFLDRDGFDNAIASAIGRRRFLEDVAYGQQVSAHGGVALEPTRR